MALAPNKQERQRAITQARRDARIALTVAGYRVALVDNNGLRWFDARDKGPCKQGHYFVQVASNGEASLRWDGDALP